MFKSLNESRLELVIDVGAQGEKDEDGEERGEKESNKF